MKDLITEARELCEKATPGPWMGLRAAYEDCLLIKCDEDEYLMSQHDVAFVARSRTLVEKLCDALEKAQEQNKQLLHEVCKLACESVERDKALARLEAEVMAACNSVRWIPVTERLPKTEKPVQVYMPKLHMSVQTGFYAKYYGEDDGEWYEHWVASGDVTHWRELPAPPEEGAEK